MEKKFVWEFYALTPLAASQKKVFRLELQQRLSLAGTKLNKILPRPIPYHLMPHLSHCGVKNRHSPANAPQPAHASRAWLPIRTYVVSRKDPSLHLSNAFLAAGFPENSTMPFPEDRPLSSTITTALSTWPNTEKASSRSSLDTN